MNQIYAFKVNNTTKQLDEDKKQGKLTGLKL